ncbi:DUF461 domain-containing protein [Streptomyces sp. NPDC048550]|uniref:DUF461 domain-containing protein n=1 Tax=unclassified Streptomyces TaxID=2593676 RepID=UPI000A70B7C3|nr:MULTISPECIES: DUF461 domain-containing protein [unclassified Streptomyces]MCX5147003.1 DUF461 domain-containing protein [Streptomyces sp. NBC_00320]WSN50172.1 DUF461 domain-containing protein [Streptomyces sp. NBC_01296]WSW60406.1 DUF461 domain-containing protein [Streptomyces sp. NBC_00998]
MSRSLRRGALAATAVVFSIASLAACGAGQNAETLQIKPDNAAVTKGDIKIQNALVITQGEKEKKGPAAVSATVFNTGDTPQTLDAITLPGGKSKVVLKGTEGAAGKVTVPAHGSVVIGGKGNASAVVEGGEAVQNGNAQKVVFQLSKAGDVGLEAFVVPATGMYAGFGPTEAPAAAPGSAPSGSPSGTPSGSPSGSPATTPSGAASGTPSGAASGSPSGSPSHSAGH